MASHQAASSRSRRTILRALIGTFGACDLSARVRILPCRSYRFFFFFFFPLLDTRRAPMSALMDGTRSCACSGTRSILVRRPSVRPLRTVEEGWNSLKFDEPSMVIRWWNKISTDIYISIAMRAKGAAADDERNELYATHSRLSMIDPNNLFDYFNYRRRVRPRWVRSIIPIIGNSPTHYAIVKPSSNRFRSRVLRSLT